MKEPQFKIVGLEDKPIIDKYLKEYPPQISELTFTNIYAWRNTHSCEYKIIDDHLLVSFFEKNSRNFYPPVGKNPSEAIKRILAEYPNSVFSRVQKSIAEPFSSDSSGFSVEHQREMDDYVYGIMELAELKGEKHRSKRRFAEKCEEKYKPEVCELSQETVMDFLKMQEKWCNLRACTENESLDAEDSALKEALKNYKELGFFGICVKIQGKIESYAIGEILNNDTFVEHFEKANTEYEGIYQFTLNAFAKKILSNPLFSHLKFLNREEDLGVEGLRKAKESWKPVKMVEKYRIHYR